MNLAEALDILPDVTTTVRRTRIFKIDPRLIGREHIEEGVPMILAHVPGSTNIFRFTRDQWELVHLFDGQRSYAEIADRYQQQSGSQIDVEDIRRYAEEMDEIDFWYLTAQEKNIALMQKLRERRKKAKKSRAGDMARVLVAQWDADETIGLWHERLRFVFTPWFTVLTLALFAFMAYIFISNWSQIGVDTLQYYTFTDKSISDLIEFWVLFFVLAFFHESAHALCCKHYQGGVHHMGFHLIYLSPAFFVDVTEAWVYANRFQRVVTMIAGIWTELMICAFAAFVWWGTPAGTATHDLAYKLILITGVAVVVMNLNPLIKLDGYYILCEATGIDEIKERSTALVSGWVQSRIFRRDVEVPYVRPARRIFFVIYALLSGAYSYLLLFAAARFVGNVFHRFSPEWAFLPTVIVAVLIFKSRLLKLGAFMHSVYLEKREGLRQWLTPARISAFTLLLLAILLIPFHHKTAQARFILEPAQRAVVRSTVAGIVSEVQVQEGQKVNAGAELVRLRNLDLESRSAEVKRDLQLAHASARDAELHYASQGSALTDLQHRQRQSQVIEQELAGLELHSPIAGTVISAAPENLLGSRLEPGQAAIEIADLSNLRARLYVAESDMHKVRLGETVKLRPDSSFRSVSGSVEEIEPAAAEVQPGLEPKAEYKGLTPPSHYVLLVKLSNPGSNFVNGGTGTAKVFAERQSLAGWAWQGAREFFRRKVW